MIDITQHALLSQVEDEMVQRCTVAVTATNGQMVVKEVAVLPGDLRDAETLRELGRTTPAIYVAYLGGRSAMEAEDVVLDTSWGVYFTTGHAGRRQDRSRGDSREVGMYHLLQYVLPALNNYTIQDIGTLVLKRVDNLFSLTIEKTGMALMASTYNLRLVLPYTLDTAGLNAFETYHAEHSIALGPDEPAAVDEINLPQ